mmetsp:Transcript_2188/g.3305  ORF Transcript_2188/g.3305 Transcript_2188/m.3305 type:complete len:83 (+) Transcript_2188:122-370(+)
MAAFTIAAAVLAAGEATMFAITTAVVAETVAFGTTSAPVEMAALLIDSSVCDRRSSRYGNVNICNSGSSGGGDIQLHHEPIT